MEVFVAPLPSDDHSHSLVVQDQIDVEIETEEDYQDRAEKQVGNQNIEEEGEEEEEENLVPSKYKQIPCALFNYFQLPNHINFFTVPTNSQVTSVSATPTLHTIGAATSSLVALPAAPAPPATPSVVGTLNPQAQILQPITFLQPAAAPVPAQQIIFMRPLQPQNKIPIPR